MSGAGVCARSHVAWLVAASRHGAIVACGGQRRGVPQHRDGPHRRGAGEAVGRGFETDVPGLIEDQVDGKTRYYVGCMI